jgi:hypothetical protein
MVKALDLLAIHNPPEAVAAKTRAIYETVLRLSPEMRKGNFSVIETGDLQRLFNLYDEQFFGGWLSRTIAATADGPLLFRLSSTMTRAGGKTIRTRIPRRDGKYLTHYEIAIASRLLFMTFGDIQRPVSVCGLLCADRLTALQRIMEHEIIHLAEQLEWGNSSCKAPRFKSLATRIFGHADTKHDLVTPREKAAADHAIHIGSKVEFHFHGRRFVGKVNRIHHRATVLVEAKDGMKYRDGKSYHKYYIPLPSLEVIEER